MHKKDHHYGKSPDSTRRNSYSEDEYHSADEKTLQVTSPRDSENTQESNIQALKS